MQTRNHTPAAVTKADIFPVMMTRGGGRLLAVGLLVTATAACGGAVRPTVSEVPTTYATARPDTTEPSFSSEGKHTSRSASPAVPSRQATPGEKPTPRQEAAPANPPARTTAPAHDPAPACAANDLTTSAGRSGPPSDSQPGWFATPILLRNKSAATCRLRGWPGITFFGDATIQGCAVGDPSPACGKPQSTSRPRSFSITRSSVDTLPDVLLAPGDTTSFTLVWEGGGMHTCVGTPFEWSPYGADIRVPGDSRALTLAPFPNLYPCEGKIEITPFGVAG
ncbi:DUF4232 domain-containing protein [Streptomyces sp. NPDC057539]|uniref:DUF4232 domain-containing protein n=1 Tax=Streptomyces sp. NPDC057539 TaxID=3346159 RepID=UPI0036A3CFD3